jgi:hypothetical protein
MTSFFRKFYFGVWKRMYTNETIILFQLRTPAVFSPDIKIKAVNESNLNDARSFQDESQLSLFRKFLKRGDKGFYGYLEGKCVHRSWVVLPPRQAEVHLFCRRPLNPDEVFIHFSETAGWARGRNIFTQVLAHIGEEFKDKHVFISVGQDNSSSIKSVRKAGFSELSRIHVRVIAGIRKCQTEMVN